MSELDNRQNVSVNLEIYHGRSLWQDAMLRFRRNKRAMIGFVIIVMLVLIALITLGIDFATNNEFYMQHVVKQNLLSKLATPSFDNIENIFGRDELGRSLFYRVIWGTRYSLFIGMMIVVLAVLLGGTLGAVAGYLGGWADDAIMRIVDIIYAVPYTLFAITIVSALGTSLTNLFISIAIPSLPTYARVTRAAVMSVKDKEYVEAARAIGANDGVILFRYLIPNSLSPIIVQASTGIASAILNIAVLSFIGLGVQMPTPEWGSILTAAKTYIRDGWHLTAIPGVAIAITTIAFNMFGDGLRDALDPKMKN